MYNRLKIKILSGFLILVLMLAVAGAVSIYEFNKLSNSVDALIEDNYKTIESCKRMVYALEREDSGVLLALLGHGAESRKIILSADSSFTMAFTVAKNNLTEVGEDKLLDEVSLAYEDYKTAWSRLLTPSLMEDNMTWYFDTSHQAFMKARYKVEALMSLNQASMYEESSVLKEKSKRAIMPGIVAIISALVFSLLLNFFISKYFVSPIGKLAEALKNYHPGRKQFTAGIETDDEIKRLERGIQELIDRLSLNSGPKREE